MNYIVYFTNNGSTQIVSIETNEVDAKNRIREVQKMNGWVPLNLKYVCIPPRVNIMLQKAVFLD